MCERLRKAPIHGPTGISAGPDGNLWIAEQSDRIGRFTTAGVLTEYPVPTAGATPVYITAGPDGHMWFTEIFGDRIGRVEVDAGTPSADLAVRLSAPATARIGSEYTYTITVTNSGPSSARDLVVTLDRPLGVPISNASPGTDRQAPTQVRWRAAALGAGQQRVFHVTVRATRPPTVMATAHVASATPDPHPANNTATASTRVNVR
ncbi:MULTISPECIES: hypothetical protein [unclassified Streptomyces]|uniref:virginiamycin B lyase family protein n=1 Tax=unclassified Streptomyces TaxID=2593676 RepID=UPI002E7FC2F3|nr:hypothetical protein [Streptomyces sp. NBC_00589]WTI33618.1 hypothetical protein OIC96_00590 [Streptomyces sp. NBC_00775]WUB32710.1 hypothetical protein OHA51_49145 [Streptomyces sp. NBC_00589]